MVRPAGSKKPLLAVDLVFHSEKEERGEGRTPGKRRHKANTAAVSAGTKELLTNFTEYKERVDSVFPGRKDRGASDRHHIQPARVQPAAEWLDKEQDEFWSPRKGRYKSNYSAVSAGTKELLTSFAENKKHGAPKVLVQDLGIVLDNDCGDSHSKERCTATGVEENLRHILCRDYSFVNQVLRKHANDGRITRHNFMEASREMKLGLTGEEIQIVLRTMDQLGHLSQDGALSVQRFLDHYGGGEAELKSEQYRSRLLKSGRKKILLDPPNAIERLNTFQKKHRREMGSVSYPSIVFFLGCCVPPFWCFGWAWINSKDAGERIFARLSACLSILLVVIGVTVATLLMIQQADEHIKAPSTEHCLTNIGVLAAIKMFGETAAYEQLIEYSAQYRFKMATHSLWYSEIGFAENTGLSPEDIILIDSVEPLTSDPQGATAKIVFRIVCADRAEQDLVKDKLPQWIKSDSWIVQLEKFNFRVSQMFLDTVVPSLASDVPIVTPSLYAISRFYVSYLTPMRRKVVQFSEPYLGRQPPMKSSAVEKVNPLGWAHHNTSVLRTCWWTGVFFVPNDPCLESSVVSCESTGAAVTSNGGQRFLEITVNSESTFDVLKVYVRQDLRKFDDADKIRKQEANPPDWYVEADFKIDGTRDSYRCIDPGNRLSCKYTYKLRIDKGPHKFQYHLGIIGTNWRAATVPFTVTAEYGNFNQEFVAFNPFAQANAAGQLRPFDEWAQTLALLMVFIFPLVF